MPPRYAVERCCGLHGEMYFFVSEKLKSRHLFIVWSFHTQGGRCMYPIFMLMDIHTCQVHAAAPFPTYGTSNFQVLQHLQDLCT